MQTRASNPLVALTTTVPVEILFAAGWRPVDLNNVFITSADPLRHVQQAERAGFAQNSCCWTKGLYSVARELGVRRVVAVTEGDCSNTHSLIEMLKEDGVQIVPFAYPFQRDRERLRLELRGLAEAFGTSLSAAEEQKVRLDRVRRAAHEIDDLTWRGGKVSGAENHLWLISCSDFLGDPGDYESRARTFLEDARRRNPLPGRKRLGLLGIPPICDGLFELLEGLGAQVAFNEVPRQFAMPFDTPNLVEQYARYTYPYDIFHRLEDIRREIARRRLDGVIHYVQSFCFRYTQDTLIRRHLDVPVLALECDRPGPLDARTQTRVEAFLEMLAHKESRQ